MLPAWPSSFDFFFGLWEDDDESSVAVQKEKASALAVLSHKNTKTRRLRISVDEWGRWTCGQGVLQRYCCKAERILWWSENDEKKHWTWLRQGSHEAEEYLAHAPFIPQVTRFCNFNVLKARHLAPLELLPVPVWALHIPKSEPGEDIAFRDGEFLFNHLEEILRNPSMVKDLPPLDAYLEKVPDGYGSWQMYCPNTPRLLALRCLQAVHVNVVLQIRCEIRKADSGQDLEPNWPHDWGFFLGQWEDHEQEAVRVEIKGSSVAAHLHKKGTNKVLRLRIRKDEYGRWTCGNGLLQAHKSAEDRIYWLSDDLSQEWTWCRKCSQSVPTPSVLAISSEPERERKSVLWPSSGAFFVGEWEDNNESIVRVELKDPCASAHFIRKGRKNLRLPINVDQHGRWTCGKGVLQTEACSPGQIVWLSEGDPPEEWIWRERAFNESDEVYMSHAPFMPQVTFFCTHSVPNIQPSREAISVPVWALRFTQYNINENLTFSDGRRIFGMLEELLRNPNEIGNLPPLDAFVLQGPDHQKALYCRNNRRLLVLRCVQAVHSDCLLSVMCRIHDPHSKQRCTHGKLRLCDWFNDGYSKPGQFPGCDGLGLDIWIREKSKHDTA